MDLLNFDKPYPNCPLHRSPPSTKFLKCEWIMMGFKNKLKVLEIVSYWQIIGHYLEGKLLTLHIWVIEPHFPVRHFKSPKSYYSTSTVMAGVDFLSSLALFKQVSTQQIANRKSYLLWFLVWISKVLLKHYKYQMQIMQYHCFRFLLGSPLESWRGDSWGNLTSNLQQPTINSELKKLLEQHFGTISNLMFWMFCF